MCGAALIASHLIVPHSWVQFRNYECHDGIQKIISELKSSQPINLERLLLNIIFRDFLFYLFRIHCILFKKIILLNHFIIFHYTFSFRKYYKNFKIKKFINNSK